MFQNNTNTKMKHNNWSMIGNFVIYIDFKLDNNNWMSAPRFINLRNFDRSNPGLDPFLSTYLGKANRTRKTYKREGSHLRLPSLTSLAF